MSLLRYHRDRLATQHILEDLEAQSPRRTHSWDVNSLHSNPPYDDNVYANEDGEFEVEYDDGVMQVDNNHQGSESNEDGEQQSDSKKTGGHCQFLKRHHYFILFTLLVLGAVIAATMIFGPIGSRNNNQNNDRTTNAAGEGEDEVIPTDLLTYAPSATPTAAPVTAAPVTASPTGTPSYFPTSWFPTYYPSYVPTGAPVGANFTVEENNGNATLIIVESNGTSLVSEGNITTEEVVVIDGNVTSNNETALFGNETTLIGNNETILIEEEVDETPLETNDNTTTLSPAESTEDIVDVITTTEATTITMTNATTTEGVTTEEATVPMTTTTEATTTSTTEAKTTEPTATTTSEVTTTTIAAALETTTTTVAAIPAHLCTDIPSGKIFKIDITPKSSTTSLELFQLQNGEYKLVTAYPTVDDEFQEFEVGTNYIKKLCVLPGVYKFVVKESAAGACYKGFFRGNRIFENCGNGEHEFEF